MPAEGFVRIAPWYGERYQEGRCPAFPSSIYNTGGFKYSLTFTGYHRCHTADIITPPGKEGENVLPNPGNMKTRTVNNLMKKSITLLLVASAILIAGIMIAGCTSSTDSTQSSGSTASATPAVTDNSQSSGQNAAMTPSGTPPAGDQTNSTAPSGTPAGGQMNGTAPSGTPPAGGPGGQTNGTAPSGTPPSGTAPSGTPPEKQ